MRHLLTILIILLLSSCTSTTNNSNDLAELVHDYFSVYSTRADFQRLISFYDNNAQFEDIIYGKSLGNKEEIKGFLDWDRGEFKILSVSRALKATKQTVKNKAVVTQGFFHEFSYDGQVLGPQLFVIIQEFNAQKKIIK